MHSNNERQLLARIAELETQQKILAGVVRDFEDWAIDITDDESRVPQDIRERGRRVLAQLKAS